MPEIKMVVLTPPLVSALKEVLDDVITTISDNCDDAAKAIGCDRGAADDMVVDSFVINRKSVNVLTELQQVLGGEDA